MTWALGHLGEIASLAGRHLVLAGVPLLLGLLLALPLGWAARGRPLLRAVLVAKIVDALLPEADAAAGGAELETISLAEPRRRDASYDMCLASWAHWLVAAPAAGTAADHTPLEEAAVALITGLGPVVGSTDAKA